MIRLVKKVLCLILSALVLAGCASILSKSDYPVVISSKPDGASFTIRNKSGEVVSNGQTPISVVLKAGSGYFKGEEYEVEFTKPGYRPFKTKIIRNMDNWYLFGNFIFGGLIGWVIVDPLTGAMWSLDDLNVILLEA